MGKISTYLTLGSETPNIAPGLANNPLYIVNYNKPDKTVNITRDRLEAAIDNLNKTDNNWEDNIYQEPYKPNECYDTVPPPKPI